MKSFKALNKALVGYTFHPGCRPLKRYLISASRVTSKELYTSKSCSLSEGPPTSTFWMISLPSLYEEVSLLSLIIPGFSGPASLLQVVLIACIVILCFRI